MGKCVLAVEGEERALTLLKGAFAEAGLTQELRIVRSSAETIRYLAGESPYDDRALHPFPSLLLLGLNIVRPGGADVLRWLQQHPELKRRLPVVAFNSLESPQEMEAAYAWGANSWISKPPDFERLVVVVRQLTDYWLGMNRLPDGS